MVKKPVKKTAKKAVRRAPKPKGFALGNADPEQIKRVAKGIAHGTIWTNLDFDPHEAPLHFLPLMFVSPADLEKLKPTLGLIYEDISKASPTGLNGKPIFMSANLLNKTDADKVMALVEQLRKAEEKVLS